MVKQLYVQVRSFFIRRVFQGDLSHLSQELVALHKEKEQLEDILSTISPDVLMVVSPERTIESCNNSVKRMFGYGTDEVIGKKTDMLYFDRRSNPEHRGEIYETLEREGYHIGLATGKKKNNDILPLEIITSKLRDRPGVVLLLRDISERRRREEGLKKQRDSLEEQVRERTTQLEIAIAELRREINERRIAEDGTKRLNEELELRVKERTEELERALEELRTLDKMKDEFLSLVSHEFRTPLTSVMSFSEILLNYPEENQETQKEFLSIIHSESKRLTRLIDNLLDLSKIQARKIEWHFQRGDLRVVVEKAIKSVSSLLTEKQLQLEIEIDEALPLAVIDEDRILQVFINLLSNAVKFTQQGGMIRITARLLEGSTHGGDGADLMYVSMSDTGIGILPDDLERIFEPFKQSGDTLKDKPKGTGLGLSICKEIIHAHHGSIWAESVQGQGSTFHITLPLDLQGTQRTAIDDQQRMLPV